MIIGVVAGIYFYNNQKQAQKTPAQESITLPLSLNNPSLASSAIFYEFRGQIKEIQEDSQGLLLITDIPNTPNSPNLPNILVDSKTKVMLYTSGQEIPGKAEMLKVKRKVIVFLRYDLNSKEWRTTKVEILLPKFINPSKAKPSSPSATKKP